MTAQPQINDFVEEEMTAEEVFYRKEVCALSPALSSTSPRSPCHGPRLPIWKKEEKGGNLIKTWRSASLAQAVFIIQS